MIAVPVLACKFYSISHDLKKTSFLFCHSNKQLVHFMVRNPSPDECLKQKTSQEHCGSNRPLWTTSFSPPGHTCTLLCHDGWESRCPALQKALRATQDERRHNCFPLGAQTQVHKADAQMVVIVHRILCYGRGLKLQRWEPRVEFLLTCPCPYTRLIKFTHTIKPIWDLKFNGV